MRRPVRTGAAALLTAVALGMSACTSDATSTASGTTVSAPAATPAPAADAPQEDVGEVPLTPGSDYERAVAAFGADQVAAAATDAARVAHIALADCHRWTTGEVDPRLTALVTPELLTRALEELDRAGSYGGGPVPSLLSHLPEDDGNGHALLTDLRGGCDGSDPLRFPLGPLRVSTAGDRPALVLAGEFAMNVRLGSTLVSAGQDWVFTMEQGADGWRLVDVDPVMANVNWAPPMAD